MVPSVCHAARYPTAASPVDLDHPGVGHRSTDRHKARTRFLGEPTGSKGTWAPSGDQGDVRQGFCVVHEGWAPPDSQRDALVGPEDRQRRAGFDEVDQSGLLAADEAIGRSEKGSVTGTVPAPPPFGHGVRDRLGCALASRRDADHDTTCAAHCSQVLRTVEYEVGCAVQEQSVLVAGGFALHRIHDDGSAPTGRRHHRQLDRRGEITASTAVQAGCFQVGRQRSALVVPIRQHQRSVDVEVPRQVTRIAQEMVHVLRAVFVASLDITAVIPDA